MVNLLLGVLEQGFKLWNTKEGTKFLDKIINLKMEWYEEYAKPLDRRSDRRLDELESELRIIAESFIQTSGAKNASSRPGNPG